MLSSKVNIPLVIVIKDGLIWNPQNGRLLEQNPVGWRKNVKLCKSVSLIWCWQFCKEKEIPIQEFLRRIIAYLLCFFRPLPKLECGKRERNHLIFLGYPHSSHLLSPSQFHHLSWWFPCRPDFISLLFPLIPSWTSCQGVWLGTALCQSPLLFNKATEEFPPVILCPFLPLPILPAACTWCDPLKTWMCSYCFPDFKSFICFNKWNADQTSSTAHQIPCDV